MEKNFKALIEELLHQAEAQQVEQFSVGALIESDNKILFLMPTKVMSFYELPSTPIKENESLFDALMRKAKELLATDIVNVENYLGYLDTLCHDQLTRQFNFSITIPLLKTSENKTHAWLTADNIQKTPMRPEVKNLIDIHWLKKKLSINPEF